MRVEIQTARIEDATAIAGVQSRTVRVAGFSVAPEVLASGPLVVLYSTNLAEFESTVVQSGGKIVRRIFEFPGGRRFHFTDPSGNELAVWSDL